MINQEHIFKKTLYLPVKNKVWGIILLPSDRANRNFSDRSYYMYYWTWWAVVGKKLSLSRHPYNTYGIDVLEEKKLSYGYKVIDENQLLDMWPDIKNEIHKKMIFEVLSKHE